MATGLSSTTRTEPTAPSTEAPAPPQVVVEPWPDPVIDALGHDPRSLYVETFWLPILGPSTTWLLRRLVRELEVTPEGCSLDASALSVDLGLGGHTGRHSVLFRSIDRCCRFGMAQHHGTALFVRRRLPPLARRQIERLPPALADVHGAWERQALEQRVDGQTSEPPVERARQLALTLVQLGETPDAVERQLHQWHFHPSLAWNAVQWAREQHPTGMESAACVETTLAPKMISCDEPDETR